MFAKQAKITNLMNDFIGKEHIFGETDCNLIIAKYIDELTGSDYYSQLYNKYTDIKSGVSVAKKIGFISAKNILEKVAVLVEYPENGDVIVQEHKLGKAVYHSTSIVWGNKALVEKQNYYSLVDLEDLDFTETYRIED